MAQYKHRNERQMHLTYPRTLVLLVTVCGLLLLSPLQALALWDGFMEFEGIYIGYTIEGASCSKYSDSTLYNSQTDHQCKREAYGFVDGWIPDNEYELKLSGYAFVEDGYTARVTYEVAFGGDKNGVYEKVFDTPGVSHFEISIPYKVPAGASPTQISGGVWIRVEKKSGLLWSQLDMNLALYGWEFAADTTRRGGPQNNPNTVFLGGNGPGQCPQARMPNFMVNTSTGNLFVQDTDYAYSGLGPGIHLTRNHNNDPGAVGMFGRNWRFSYESHVQRYFCWDYIFRNGEGQAIYYTGPACGTTLNPPVTLKPQKGCGDTLTIYSGYILRKEKQTGWIYRYEGLLNSGDFAFLTSIEDAHGNKLQLNYNEDHTIQKITDAAGRVVSFDYNADKRCTSMTLPDGRQASFEYDADANLVKTTDIGGYVTTYIYDSKGFMTSFNAAGKIWRFDYINSPTSRGGWKYLSQVTDPLGNITGYSLEGPDAANTFKNSVRDPQGNKTTHRISSEGYTTEIVDSLGNTSSATYNATGLPVSHTNARGETVQITYDARCNPVKVIDPLGNTISYTYDGNDNLLKLTDPLGNISSFFYDDHNQLIKQQSPLGHETTIQYTDTGLVKAITDAMGRTTLFGHDNFGNSVSMTDPLGKTSQLTYDATGLTATAVKDASGNMIQMSHDANDRPVKIIFPDGGTQTITYDCCIASSMTDQLGNVTILERDALLNLTRITGPAGDANTFSYDKNNNLINWKNPKGLITQFSYDQVNRNMRITDPAGSYFEKKYDANGNMISLTDQRANTTTFAFDARDYLSSETNPLSNIIRSSRDSMGRVSAITNVRGNQVTFVYDKDGRMSAINFDGVRQASFAYNGAANLLSVLDSTGTTQFNYSLRDEIIGITYSDGKTASFSYDDAGNLKSVTYPGGISASYTYDNRNRVSSASWGGHQLAFTYDKVGTILKESRSNGTTTTYTYDRSYLPLRLSHQKGSDVLAQLEYTRDTLGNVTQQNTTAPVSVNLTSSSSAGSYNTANRIEQWAGSNYTYDSDGNLLSMDGSPTLSAQYDPMNRLVSMTLNHEKNEYGYDGFGNRVMRKSGSAILYYHYDMDGRLLFATNATGVVQTLYFYVNAKLAGMWNAATGYVFYHFDDLGNTLFLSNTEGNVVASYAYEPSGRISNSNGSIANPFTFVGAWGVMHERDGIYFMRNRYYDANTGRFLQRDPLGVAGDVNGYLYVGNNPINGIDPAGLAGFDPKNDMFYGTQGTAVMGYTFDPVSGKLPVNFTDSQLSDAEVEAINLVVLEPGKNAIIGVADAFVGGGASWIAEAMGITVDTQSWTYGLSLWGSQTAFLCTGAVVASLASQAGKHIFYSGGKMALKKALRAAAKGKGVILAQTIGGSFLNHVHKHYFKLPNIVWETASAIFAANSRRASVHFGSQLRPGAIWETEKMVLNLFRVLIK